MTHVRDQKDAARLTAQKEQRFTDNEGFDPETLQFVTDGNNDETCSGISEVMKSADLGSVFLKGGLGGKQVVRGLLSEERISMGTLQTCKVRDLNSLNYSNLYGLIIRYY